MAGRLAPRQPRRCQRGGQAQGHVGRQVRVLAGHRVGDHERHAGQRGLGHAQRAAGRVDQVRRRRPVRACSRLGQAAPSWRLPSGHGDRPVRTHGVRHRFDAGDRPGHRGPACRAGATVWVNGRSSDKVDRAVSEPRSRSPDGRSRGSPPTWRRPTAPPRRLEALARRRHPGQQPRDLRADRPARRRRRDVGPLLADERHVGHPPDASLRARHAFSRVGPGAVPGFATRPLSSPSRWSHYGVT